MGPQGWWYSDDARLRWCCSCGGPQEAAARAAPGPARAGMVVGEALRFKALVGVASLEADARTAARDGAPAADAWFSAPRRPAPSEATGAPRCCCAPRAASAHAPAAGQPRRRPCGRVPLSPRPHSRCLSFSNHPLCSPGAAWQRAGAAGLCRGHPPLLKPLSTELACLWQAACCTRWRWTCARSTWRWSCAAGARRPACACTARCSCPWSSRPRSRSARPPIT